MGALFLYLFIAAAILWTWSRFVQRVSRAAAIVLILLPMLFTGRALLTGRIYSVTDFAFVHPPLNDYVRDYGIDKIHNGYIADPFAQIVPWQQAVRTSLARGEWPVWNPFILNGDILAAGMQAAPYDPFNLIALVLPLDVSITFTATLTFFLAALFAFAFAREHDCSEGAALIAAAGFMLCESMAFTIGWAPHARSWAYLGFVLLAVRRVVLNPGRSAGATLLIALTLLVFAGHPESLFHVVMFGCAYGLFLMATQRKNIVRALLVATSAGVGALLLTAISLLPFLAAAPQSSEYVMRHGYYKLMPLHSDAKLVARRAGTTFLPFYGGSPWRSHATAIWDTGAGRVGSVIFALAAAAMLIAPRRRESWFFFIAGLICLAAHFEAPPVAQLLHKLPLFDIALNDRLSFAAAFSFALLAAFAADAWRRPSAIPIAIVAIALGLATAFVWKSQLAAGVERSLITSTLLIELLPLVVIAILLRIPRSVALPLVLALLCAQRVLEDGGNYPSLPRRTFFPRTPAIDAMKAREPFRIVGVGATLIPNTSAMYGLEDARGYEAMTFSRLDRTYDMWCVRQAIFFNRVDDLTRPFLSAMNVRFAIAPRSLAPPDGWRVVADDRNVRVLENLRVLPRVFVPRVVHVRNNDEAVLAEMSVAKDFANDGWLMTPLLPPHDQPTPRATIVTKHRGSRYEIHTSYDADGWLFITESNWKGWRVTVDGQRVGTAYANQAFIGIAVARGDHVVRAEYLPREFVIGRAVSGIALLALVLTLIGVNLFAGPKRFAR